MKTGKGHQEIVFFILVNLISPWFWMILLHPASWTFNGRDLYQVTSPARISEINKLRGEAEKAGWATAGRLAVNKITWTAKEAFSRTTESLDPNYLFFEGDLNINRSTRRSGPVFLFTLPLLLAGLAGIKDKKKILFWGLILLIPGSFFEPHYFSPAKLGFLLWWNWLAALGIIRLIQWKAKPALKWIFSFAALSELVYFIHDLTMHYPFRNQ